MDLRPDYELFENAMEDNWDKVYKAYGDEQNIKSGIQTAKVDKSDDTVLHVAVLRGKTEAVKKLVELTKLGKLEDVLGAKNEKGNTPLHLAAALGFTDMCFCLAQAYPDVIAQLNYDKETPYFLAALHGKTDVFLLLHRICKERLEDKLDSLFRKEDGDTILHSAINGEFFDLAYKIILKYKDNKQLMDARDGHGHIPLHILAEKHHAFESGNPPGIFDWLLYQCVIVTVPFDSDEPDETDTETQYYPPNYETCVDVVCLIANHLHLLKGNPKGKDGKDIENPPKSGSSAPSGEQGKSEGDKPEPNQSAAGLRGDSNINTGMPHYNRYPPNYQTIVHILQFIVKLLLVILGVGVWKIPKIAHRKRQHHWANLVAKELIQADTTYKFEGDGTVPPDTSRPEGLESPEHDTLPEGENTTAQKPPAQVQVDAPSSEKPTTATPEKRDARSSRGMETPFLVAARTGITEIVEGLLKKYPTAIHDTDPTGKNALLLAVEHRQTHVFNLLQNEKGILTARLLRHHDNNGNTALHLAATFGEHHPRTPGAALRMQWEMKWFKYVKIAMPPEYVRRRNNNGQTPHEVLTSTHQDLVAKAGEWMTKTSESCSVVAALIATVAFATSATIPGGVNQETGEPVLKDHPLFHVFAIASLAALCFSVTAMVLFLTILTSRYQERDFAVDLPRRLLLGLTTLFTSIAAILVSFCAGHFFLIKESAKSFAYPIYAATCLPVTYFGLAQIPLYFDLLVSTFRTQPQASYRH